MPQTEIWTVKRLLEWTTDFFRKKAIESPRLEAEILLAAAMKIKRIELYTHFETEPTEIQRTQFREFVKRRGAGEPVAYLVGFKEFYSLPFKIDRNVLIPRPETEQLVLETLDILKNLPEHSAPVVCDVGTGSGVIAIALAKNGQKFFPSAKMIAVDISAEALAIAADNAVFNGVDCQIEFCRSDLLTDVGGSFDVIVSNLPYISQSEYDALPGGIRNFEPKIALLAGINGTEIIERLVVQALARIKSGGYLLLEVSPMIAESVAGLLNAWDGVRILKDNNGQQRIVCCRNI